MRKFPSLLFAALALAPALARADDAACDALPPVPAALAKASLVEEYHSTLKLCAGPGGAERIATREMRIGGRAALLTVDPASLSTQVQAASCWRCRDVEEDAIGSTRFLRDVDRSAEAPGLTKRGFLQNAGLTHGGSEGAFLTGDLCPSTKPLERGFLERLGAEGAHAPISLSISGLWLTHHFADYRWLLDRQASGALDITWVNHTYHHQFKRGAPFDHNFMLTPGVDPDAEILDTERLLIANGQTPSVFFRFPGLISSAPLMQAARRHHLISLGADAWLALREKPTPGSIVLVHANGNEPAGLKIYTHDVDIGAMPKPLEPLTDAPP